MNKVLKNSWALFLGMGFLMMAYGFQGSLLGVRAVQEEFSLTATGFMMSGYFVGYFIGAATIPNIISRVGHIRVFAAFASLASLVILVHSVFKLIYTSIYEKNTARTRFFCETYYLILMDFGLASSAKGIKISNNP